MDAPRPHRDSGRRRRGPRPSPGDIRPAGSAFLGVNGVSPDAGYTVVDFDAAQVKRAMIAREVVVVADSGKLGAVASICPLSNAHVLMTDAPPEEPLADALAAAGVEVVAAP